MDFSTVELSEDDRAFQDEARRFLSEQVTDEVIRHLEEVMGYTLQGTRSLAAWVMLFGTGSNGKSFVAQVLQALMGPSSCASLTLAGRMAWWSAKVLIASKTPAFSPASWVPPSRVGIRLT